MKTTVIVIICAVVTLLLFVTVFFIVLQPIAISEPTSEPRTESKLSSVSTPDLVDALRRLDDSTRTLSDRMERLGRQLESYGAVAEKTTTKEKPAKLLPGNGVAKLTAAIQTLDKSIRTMPVGARLAGGQSFRQRAEPRILTEVTDMKTRWNSDKDAKRSLFLKSFVEVLQELGPPNSINGNNTTSWFYKNGAIRFINGHVCYVDVHGVK